jgi:hypothetical protein
MNVYRAPPESISEGTVGRRLPPMPTDAPG